MNATNFATNKDFRKTVDIRQKVRQGKIEKKIYLPPEDFAYGLPNRPPTPSIKDNRPPEVITRYINPKAEEYKMRELEKKGLTTGFQDKEKEKPLYKLRMFQDVGSKVAEEVKLFKTYHPYRKKQKVDDGVDYLINKVQGEIEQNDKEKMKNLNNYQNPPQQVNNNVLPQNQYDVQAKPEPIPQ